MSQGVEHFSDVFFLGWVALKIGLGWIAGQHSMEAIFSDVCFGEKNTAIKCMVNLGEFLQTFFFLKDVRSNS